MHVGPLVRLCERERKTVGKDGRREREGERAGENGRREEKDREEQERESSIDGGSE